MRRVTIGSVEYEATHRDGLPAIRSLNKSGGTLRWYELRSETALAVMRAAGIEPAMAPGFAGKKQKEGSTDG